MILFGIWTFPNQNPALASGGDIALLGISFAVYEQHKDRLKEISDFNDVILVSSPSETFFFSNIYKYNLLPIYDSNE